MAAGIEIYNASGQLVLTLGDRAFRLLTVQDTNGNNGTINIPELVNGTPSVIVQTTDAGVDKPVVEISGNNVSWTFRKEFYDRDVDSRILIGVY